MTIAGCVRYAVQARSLAREIALKIRRCVGVTLARRLLGSAEMTQQGCLLVIEEPLRESVADAITTNGYAVHEARTPLEVIHVLERHSVGIAYVLLSSACPGAEEVDALLAAEYPTIQRLVLND